METAERLRRSERLRREVDGELQSRLRRRVSRARRWSTALLTVAVLGALSVDGWLAYGTFSDRDASSAAADERPYSDLEIFESPTGAFAGRVALSNRFDRDVQVYVTVNIYSGGQEVGEVFGDVTLKPRSESTVALDGVDEFVAYSESRVHISGWPVGVAGSE